MHSFKRRNPGSTKRRNPGGTVRKNEIDERGTPRCHGARNRVEDTIMSSGQGDNHIFQSIFGGCCMVNKDGNGGSAPVMTTSVQPAQARTQAEKLNQQVGIGVVVSVVGEDLVIDEIAPGGPAAMAGGLQLGDVLVRVDGREVRGGKPDAELLGLILGPAGSKVKIGVKRGGNPEVINVTMTRARVKK